MEILKLKEMLVDIAISIPGIKEINFLTDELAQNSGLQNSNSEVLTDRVNVISTPNGYNFFISVTLIVGIFARVIISEFHQRLTFEMKKNQLKFNKLTIIIEGIK
ncbi:hypothetical protein BCF59_0291 [Mycoplasmopsis mustelae]|uniref:Uncharacterized protein n=1 Tax=Mycoplasmopsis mustelae TaxID=171289 RepID=A0A4R7UEH8_9BACT|nr:hypothetical protein [Mycoplasmopsis mustelae]TDV24331.1 hypothetical protein BCF59_0291 [Mycoplasmopsis mustelae]